MKVSFYKLNFFIILLWFLAACSGGSEKPPKSQKKPADQIQADSGEETAAPVTINQVNLFLETSASMSGYLTGATEFKSVVSGLIAGLEKIKSSRVVKNTSYFLIPQDTVVQKVDGAAQFLNMLKSNTLAGGKNSLIVDILTMLQSHNNPQTVNMFISDFILSDFDINNKSIIQEQVTLIFNRYADASTATSIYAFNSQFNGKYYPYPRGVQTYNGVERPFYIWFFGDSRKVDALNQALRKNGFTPEQELHFGFNFDQSPAYTVMNYAGKEGKFVVAKNNKSVEDIEWYKGRTLQMGVGLNLSAFPDKLTSSKYLENNLQFIGKNVEGEIVSVQPLSQLQLQKADNSLVDNNNLTHLATIQISNIQGKQGSFDLVLEKKEDTWYQKWSTDDDSTIGSNEGKTFALKYLINGVKQAYRNDNNYFSITIPVVKE